MKHIYLILLGLLVFTSCDMKEEVYITEAGLVDYGIHVDFTKMMQAEPIDPVKNPEFPLDTILTAKQMITFQKDKDDIGPNLQNDATYQLFKDFNFHIKMDNDASFIRIFLPQKSLSGFNSFMKKYDVRMQNYIDSLAKNRDLPDSLKSSDLELPFQSKLQLTYDGKTFERIGKFERIHDLDEEKPTGGMEEVFIKFMNYTVVYHFPKPIKTISDSSALMSVDRKTIYIKKPMRVLDENPYAYNFKVTFE